jgi:hypothetical protein
MSLKRWIKNEVSFQHEFSVYTVLWLTSDVKREHVKDHWK